VITIADRSEVDLYAPKPQELLVTYVQDSISLQSLREFSENPRDSSTIADLELICSNLGTAATKLYVNFSLKRWQRMAQSSTEWLRKQQRNQPDWHKNVDGYWSDFRKCPHHSRKFVECLSSGEWMRAMPSELFVSDKFEHLKRTLLEHYGNDRDAIGLILVERRSMATALSLLIEQISELSQSFRCVALTGEYEAEEQKKIVAKLREKVFFNLLVATK
jgi:hypothetical protein